MKRLKYAMVGGAMGSFIGPIHRMAIRMDALADLVAGCFSRDPRTNARSAAKFRIEPSRAYADWKALVDGERGRIDFLVVATTNESHYAIAKAALKAGINVFCEKPLSLTLKEANELGRLAAKGGCVLGVPFTYTGYPMVKLARDLVKRGELGHIDKVVMEYVQGSFRKPDRRTSWKTDPKIAGPSCVVADIGVHAFTMIEYVTVTSKVATGEENGVRLRVYGDKASLFWDQEAPNYLSVKYPMKPEMVYKRKAPYVGEVSARSVAASRFPAGHHEGFVEALANIYDEFVAAIVSGRKCDFPGAREGIRSMKFVEAALKSDARGNRWTKV